MAAQVIFMAKIDSTIQLGTCSCIQVSHLLPTARAARDIFSSGTDSTMEHWGKGTMYVCFSVSPPENWGKFKLQLTVKEQYKECDPPDMTD